MRKEDLIELRELVTAEVQRRERLKELLDNELVQEYLNLTGTKAYKDIDSDDIKEIINSIIGSLRITKTNKLYVCTSAFYVECSINYEETSYYSKNVRINSDIAEAKIYRDIESGDWIRAYIDKDIAKERYGVGKTIREFERNNIVFNPYNTNDNQNGFNEVRADFFENALEYGQSKSKKILLKKYPRL